jgi:hypothetical protein
LKTDISEEGRKDSEVGAGAMEVAVEGESTLPDDSGRLTQSRNKGGRAAAVKHKFKKFRCVFRFTAST